MNLRTIVLAGGLGTRLRPYTFAIPKPLIPIGETPIVELLIEHLAAQGVSEVYLAVGYRGDLIQHYLGDGTRFGVNIRCVHEPKRLGTAGPVRLVRDRFDLDGPLLVINADILTSVDLRRMFEFHARRETLLTVGIVKRQQRIPFGRVTADSAGRLLRIEEKPNISMTVSAGIYMMDMKALDAMPADDVFDMPDLITALIAKDHRVYTYEIREPWSALESSQDWRDITAEHHSRSRSGVMSRIAGSAALEVGRELPTSDET